MKRYIVRWYVPALAEWIEVITVSGLEQARASEAFFRRGIVKHWIGELRTAIVEVTEIEI